MQHLPPGGEVRREKLVLFEATCVRVYVVSVLHTYVDMLYNDIGRGGRKMFVISYVCASNFKQRVA